MGWEGRDDHSWGGRRGENFLPPVSEMETLLSWEEGIEESPGGAARELVQPHVWSSAVWITPMGEAFRRYYNPVSQAWGCWEQLEVVLDPEGVHFGFHVDGRWVSCASAIATAWLHRAPHSRAHVRVLDGRAPVDVRNLVWGEPEEPEAPEADEAGETWAPLRWSCGLAPCDARYQISSRARLRAPSGAVTRGFCAHGTRWAACRGSGLVHLQAAAGLVAREVRVSPRVFAAYQSLSIGVTVDEHARRHGLRPTLAWDYYALAAPLVPKRRALGRRHVSPALWQCLEALRDDPTLGGRLRALHDEVARRLGHAVPLEELRFARTCLV